MSSLVEDLITLSNELGADPDYVRAGGGNSSVKVDGVLWIKPSGTPLATLRADDLVGLRIEVLLDALHSDAPVEGDPVQVAARAARVDAGGRRPSVEILFHALIPDPLVVHLHPLATNALTCNRDAAELTAALFGDEALLVGYTDPGVPLARAVEQARADYQRRTGRRPPAVTFLGNHGIIVSGDSAERIRADLDRVHAVLRAALEATGVPQTPPPAAAGDRALVCAVAPVLRALLGTGRSLAAVACDTGEVSRQVTTSPAGRALATGGPLIPDQIVYAGSFPLVIEPVEPSSALDAVTAALAGYRQTHGRDPLTAVLPGVATFGIGPDPAAARNAVQVLVDHLQVARDADRLGAVRPLDAAERGFIENWEAEAYRKSVAAATGTGRLAGKVALVTGAAQGFGLGIAEELLTEGASVLLADLNIDLATRNAARLSEQHGPGRALAVQVNVADEQSTLDMATACVLAYGGIDIFISNAGIARADSITGQTVSDFDLVTAINYKGYFLGVRAVTPIMTAQHRARPDLWFDIIEINSKSGLEGSKRNFAYSGSKFGGIGLTQSFALECVDYGIKVNAICPGNYLDGPLWSDPERGLFVQYLNAGKVPGATTVDDVREFYLSKVPMHRGCLPLDIARAVYYIVEQQYETGQALPVTGGQTMLN